MNDQAATINERAVLEDQVGTFSLAQLYAVVEAAGVADRDRGNDVVHGATDTRWKRRVRGALQDLKRDGRARRLGPSVWVIDGEPSAPRAAVLISLDGAHGQIELRLARAADLLQQLETPPALICVDPPYGLGVGRGPRHDTGARLYARDASTIVPGYIDVDPAAYRSFTTEWVQAAARALTAGGYLAAITGPQQAAWVQVAAEDAGLTYVNSVAVGRVFALRTTRRFAHAHWTVTIMCSGPLTSPVRVFTPPPDLPKARSGVDYPLDLWPIGDVGRADARPGQVRYPNSLPVALVDRVVGALTREPTSRNRDLVCDPFVGGGTTALVALRRGLRFVGGDVNPAALAFTAARLSRQRLAGEVAA